MPGVEKPMHYIFNVTSYHVGGMGDEVLKMVTDEMKMYMGTIYPAWTAVDVECL
jgi:hypothetical protein